MLENEVKLVIWDLDDTFWSGTLSEEEITAIDGNVQLVKQLSERGIVNSICSKNDPLASTEKLFSLGVLEFFVFPSIGFQPKGRSVSETIERMGLRTENVLFIDDNVSNLEEARFFNPGIMTLHPDQAIPALWEHPNSRGKPDPELNRLKQYRVLQRKVEEWKTSSLSNEEFLRSSNISIFIDYDVKKHFDRIVDLINRANQLNFTKRRIETDKDVGKFSELLTSFGYHAACIHVADNYGDYGMVGFYLLRRRAKVKRLVHFVFSCRTMHMGIEQYVYELLGEPDIEIAPPVAYELKSHDSVNWIRNVSDIRSIDGNRDQKLLLLGGCDLLQLASYCSSNRVEFVNRSENGLKVTYNNPGFILTDREAIRRCPGRIPVGTWSYEEAVRFDEEMGSCEIVIVSMWPAMLGKYVKTRGGVLLQLPKRSLKAVRKDDPAWLSGEVEEVAREPRERLELVLRALRRLLSLRNHDGRIFVLGCYTRGGLDTAARQPREEFNAACREFCRECPGLMTYLDTNSIVPSELLVNKTHFSPQGYLRLAQHILAGSAAPCGSEAVELDHPQVKSETRALLVARAGEWERSPKSKGLPPRNSAR